MRRSDAVLLGLSSALLLAVAIPVVAQGGPQSLLPPGFGEPDATPPPATSPAASAPSSAAPGAAPSAPLALPADDTPDNADEPDAEDAEAAAQAYDMPATARRSLGQVGVLTAATGGVSADAYGPVRGQFLIGLMRSSRAPFVSRWASITLRRVLLSSTATPGDVNGADLAAERAALLLRMGEADGARLLVQSVDNPDVTPRLYDVAMTSYMATADPAGLCPIVAGGANASDDPRWQMAQAICASFSSDQGMASAVLGEMQRRGRMRGIDYRLAEKTVGAGPNSRRSVRIEWTGVDRIDPWRFGLATATNVEIPAPLLADAGDAIRAWSARAPTLSAERRQAGVATAARLGVFSGDALAGYYARLGDAGDDVAADTADAGSGKLLDAFRRAYAGGTLGERLGGMRDFWSVPPADGVGMGPGGVSFAALPALARAAAALPPSADVGKDAPWVLGAMFAGGYDRNAARWTRAVDAMTGEGRDRAWALLAVGSPDSPGVTRAKIENFVGSDTSDRKVASRLLVASLLGLGRLDGADARALADELGMQTSARSRWARAIAQAAQLHAKGTVALLAAVGMQTQDWAQLPPEHLVAILMAMRSVGLEPEARMIAAEAMTRV